MYAAPHKRGRTTYSKYDFAYIRLTKSELPWSPTQARALFNPLSTFSLSLDVNIMYGLLVLRLFVPSGSTKPWSSTTTLQATRVEGFTWLEEKSRKQTERYTVPLRALLHEAVLSTISVPGTG